LATAKIMQHGALDRRIDGVWCISLAGWKTQTTHCPHLHVLPSRECNWTCDCTPCSNNISHLDTFGDNFNLVKFQPIFNKIVSTIKITRLHTETCSIFCHFFAMFLYCLLQCKLFRCRLHETTQKAWYSEEEEKHKKNINYAFGLRCKLLLINSFIAVKELCTLVQISQRCHQMSFSV